MEQYNFINEQIQSLIRTLKRQDYKTEKYLEDNIIFDDQTGNIIYMGDKVEEVLSRIIVRDRDACK